MKGTMQPSGMSRFTFWALLVSCGALFLLFLAVWVSRMPDGSAAMIPASASAIVWVAAVLGGGAAVLWLYLLPSRVARAHGHRNQTALAVANVLLGWTLLGWCVCLVWALMDSEREKVAAPGARPPTVPPL